MSTETSKNENGVADPSESDSKNANRQNRVLTSFIVAAPMFALLLLGGPFVQFMLLVPPILISVEWALLTTQSDNILDLEKRKPNEFVAVIMGTALVAFLGVTGHIVIALWVCLILFGLNLAANQFVSKRPNVLGSLGILYCALPYAFAGDLLNAHENGQYLLMVCMSLVWCGDIGAYYVGQRFGKTRLPLVAAVSPKKSVEGVFGGILGSTLGGLYFLVFFPIPIWLIFLLPIFALAAQAGDLLESFVKRTVGRKDSGNLLPGHGGLMDRMDGFTLLMPLVWGLNVVTGGALWG